MKWKSSHARLPTTSATPSQGDETSSCASRLIPLRLIPLTSPSQRAPRRPLHDSCGNTTLAVHNTGKAVISFQGTETAQHRHLSNWHKHDRESPGKRAMRLPGGALQESRSVDEPVNRNLDALLPSPPDERKISRILADPDDQPPCFSYWCRGFCPQTGASTPHPAATYSSRTSQSGLA
jgi:hypothetical protein